MNMFRQDGDLDGLLRQIYFHELDERERIFSRLQLNFGLYATAIASATYMCRMMDYGANAAGITLFFVFLVAFAVFLTKSIYYTGYALTGFQYVLFPNAVQSVAYRADVFRIQDEDRREGRLLPQSGEVEAYVSETLAHCADSNRRINEVRKTANRTALLWLFGASLPLLASAICFVGFDLDASSPRKNHLVEDSKLRTSIDKLNSTQPQPDCKENRRERSSQPLKTASAATDSSSSTAAARAPAATPTCTADFTREL